MKMKKERLFNLSNVSFASPQSCLLHYYTLCKHCHLVVAAAMTYLFIYCEGWGAVVVLVVGGGGESNNVSHLDTINWVVFGMARSPRRYSNIAIQKKMWHQKTNSESIIQVSAVPRRELWDATAHFTQ